VNDGPGNRETITDVVRRLGSSVEAAASGHPVLEQVTARQFDAAMGDVKVPSISELEVLQAFKTVSHRTEVIFIMDDASLPRVPQAINGSAFAFLTKPFETEHLLGTLHKACQHLADTLRRSEERYLVDRLAQPTGRPAGGGL
jgi:DNA-binding NtrC family response regulator